MRGPEKPVSQEQMWSILKKRAPNFSPPAVETPKAELREPLAPLEWDKPVRTGPNSGYVLTLCGRYSVSKDSVMGTAMYTAWRRNSAEMAKDLGIRDHLNEAKHLCELDRK